MSVEKILEGQPFFANFGNHERSTLAAVLKVRQYLDRQVVFREGERGNSCYFVVSGEIVNCKMLFGSKKKEVLGHYGAGAVFGVVSLVDLLPRSSTCFAHGTTTLLELCSDDFERLFGARSAFAFKFQEMICKVLVEQLKRTNENLAYFSSKPKKERKVEDAFDAILKANKLVNDLGFNLDAVEVVVPEGMKYRRNAAE